MEVHAGTGQGRPVVATTLVAGLLVASLALAGWQVADKRALLPPERLGDSPLVYRAPEAWQRVGDGVYILPAPARWRQRGLEYTKSLTVGYEFNPRYAIEPVGPAMQTEIGTIAALQWRQQSRGNPFRGVPPADVLIRAGKSEDGDVVVLVLKTYTGLSLGDYALLDDVAGTVEIRAAADGRVAGTPVTTVRWGGIPQCDHSPSVDR